MAVASDGPGWGRNHNMVRASATGETTGREVPRSAAADYGRATMTPLPSAMPPFEPEPHRPATAASRYGAAPRMPEPHYPRQAPAHDPAGYANPYPNPAPAYPPGYDPAYAPPEPAYGAAPDYAAVPEPALPEAPAGPPTRVALLANRVTRWTRYAGAAASVALVLGVAWWSYELLMRDVKGVPVVRALEGPMRIAPENPGGEVSTDVGLAVNAIAALGTAAPPEEELALAPVATRLTEEDLSVVVQPLAEDEEPPPPIIVTQNDFSAFEAVPAPTQAAPQPADVTETTEEPVEEPAAEAAEAPAAPPVPGIPDTVERPRARPPALNTAPAAEPAAATTTATVSGPLPSGTPLVQFGAYDSLALAAGEWDRLQGRFSGLMSGKTRVIQEATSGGRTFFRLRATGFGDLADARRFCSAMVAEGAECIPTVEP